MLTEVLEALAPRDGAHYIDGTFGGGGYARAILEAADCRVLGIDRDPDAIARGQALVRTFRRPPDSGAGRILPHGRIHATPSDGVVLDLGVSSFQFDTAGARFFLPRRRPAGHAHEPVGRKRRRFRQQRRRTARWPRIIARYGEEKNARRIARAIIAARPVTGTAQLAEIVSEAQGPAALRHAIHPATRTFQALRIHVNDELGELERGLDAALTILKPARPAGGGVVPQPGRPHRQAVPHRATATPRPRASRHAPDARRAHAPRSSFSPPVRRPRRRTKSQPIPAPVPPSCALAERLAA